MGAIMKQYEAVELAMEKLGGIETLGQLNYEVFKIKDCEWKTKTPFASIRRIVQQDKNIYKIKPGLYALKTHQKELENLGIIVETDKNKDSEALRKFNHSYYQGLLLTIVNLRNLKTFVPHQDRNKLYGKQKLSEIGTLQKLPPFSYKMLVQRSSTIDVIWFNERNMPDSFFEVEHSTDIQNSLLKFNDLRDFYARMIIVADERRKAEYIKKIHYSSFENLNKENRVRFLSYSQLEEQYNQELKKQKFEFIL